MKPKLNVILLHDQMVDKQGKRVCTSLTMIDVHDIARSSRTFGLQHAFIAHPAPALRRLAFTLKGHWEHGHGSTYNPSRREALEHVEIVSDIDEALAFLDKENGKLPKLIATSAKVGGARLSFGAAREMISTQTDESFLLMLGTGWGMSDELLERADYFLEPILGPTEYNHLSVRSACAIMLSRLMGV